ncbi:hypothetical protein [Bartonella sp. B1099]|uniref:hypothetical protein n=1 Tax=Bartonella sp. B1099 TaxID=2911422 RepID=UPI0020C33482|nr:hypothetical protein [Bartonella sp. B1099]
MEFLISRRGKAAMILKKISFLRCLNLFCNETYAWYRESVVEHYHLKGQTIMLLHILLVFIVATGLIFAFMLRFSIKKYS